MKSKLGMDVAQIFVVGSTQSCEKRNGRMNEVTHVILVVENENKLWQIGRIFGGDLQIVTHVPSSSVSPVIIGI
jgi:hypothetical protein